MRSSWLLASLLLSIAGCAPNRVDNHSAGRDPDIAPTDTLANVAREVHVGQSALRPLPPVAARTLAAPVTPVPEPETPEPETPDTETPAPDLDSEPAPMPPHLEVAHRFIGVTEQPKDSNRGPEVESFLAAVGLAPRREANGDWKSYPYCAAFVSYCLNTAGDGVGFPTKRTAAAREFIDNTRSIFFTDDAEAFGVRGGSIRANVVQRGTVPIPPRHDRHLESQAGPGGSPGACGAGRLLGGPGRHDHRRQHRTRRGRRPARGRRGLSAQADAQPRKRVPHRELHPCNVSLNGARWRKP